ncbi:MAG TPA: tripartite tricarboxylate transporter substrate binding protein, partial [Thermohalobaculum sp.]|nr:tripartite tricarboxylate transporter substrate binding protein [Thermohalobaculum sp.]
MVLTRRMMMAAGAAVIGFAGLAGTAQAWEPVKPIEFVIMAGAGGGADQIARFIQSVAEKHDLSPRPLVPNNKGGGSGAEALIALKEASDPDHTILVTLNSFFTTPLRQPNLGIDIMTFTPVEMMGVDPFVLWVHKDSGITTFEDWVAKVGNDGSYIMGGTGKGQEDSIVVAWLEKNYGLKIKYIPYKGGGAVAKDLAGQQIMASVNNPSEARGFYQSGDLVPLISFSDERLPNLPDVRTVKELGKDFSYYNQRAVVGAPGMSDDAA